MSTDLMQVMTDEASLSTVAEAESTQITYYVATSSYIEATFIALAAVLFFLAFARQRHAAWLSLAVGSLLVFVAYPASIALFKMQPQGGVLAASIPYISLLGWGVILVGALLAFTRANPSVSQIGHDAP